MIFKKRRENKIGIEGQTEYKREFEEFREGFIDWLLQNFREKCCEGMCNNVFCRGVSLNTKEKVMECLLAVLIPENKMPIDELRKVLANFIVTKANEKEVVIL